MIENEWMASTDPQTMLEFLHGKVTDRKLRLFAVACCRLIWDELKDECSRNAVITAEAFADGLATQEELSLARRSAGEVVEATGFYGGAAWVATQTSAFKAAQYCLREAGTWDEESEVYRDKESDLARDIFGNPFRPVTLDPRWRTSTVIDLARSIYEGFPRQAGGYVGLGILADALMDAGCDDEQILTHCRGEGPHVKGCWVVDLILGKS